MVQKKMIYVGLLCVFSVVMCDLRASVYGMPMPANLATTFYNAIFRGNHHAGSCSVADSALNDNGFTRYGSFLRTNDQSVASGARIDFNTTVISKGLAPAGTIGFYYPGVYLVLFTAHNAVNSNKFGLTVNDIPVPFTTYGPIVGGGVKNTIGIALVMNTLPAKTIARLDVVNNGSLSAAIARSIVVNGGSDNAASLIIVGLSACTVG